KKRDRIGAGFACDVVSAAATRLHAARTIAGCHPHHRASEVQLGTKSPSILLEQREKAPVALDREHRHRTARAKDGDAVPDVGAYVHGGQVRVNLTKSSRDATKVSRVEGDDLLEMGQVVGQGEADRDVANSISDQG